MNEKLYPKATSSDTEDEYLETKLQRYPLSKLYALRKAENSQRRPELRAELQNLSFWKFNNNEQTVGTTENAAGGEPDVSGIRPQRQVNLRDRPLIFPRNTGGSRIDGMVCVPNSVPKPSPLDQRSNSIAILMPAFAKKKIVAEAAASQQNNGGMNAGCDDEERFRNASARLDHSNVHTNGPKGLGKFQSTIRSTSPHRKSMGRHVGNDNDDYLSNLSSPNARHERRIGSGRLLHREASWDYHEKTNNSMQKHAPNNSRFSERSNAPSTPSRGYDRRNNVSGGDLSNTHNSVRRMNTGSNDEQRPQRRYNDRNDEPEWFSGGPTSQNDTIELRGFDDPLESNDNSDTERRSNYDTDHHNRNSNNRLEKESQEKTEISTEIQKPTEGQKEHFDRHKDSDALKPISKEFNYDAFLNLDPFDPEFMRSEVSSENEAYPAGGSRFKRWFASRDKSEETVQNTAPDHDSEAQRPPNNILEFIQQAKGPNTTEQHTQRMDMPSVEELEARMRKMDFKEKDNGRNEDVVELNQQKMQPGAQDMEAFKKLLEQLNNANGNSNNMDIVRDHLPSNCMPTKLTTAQNLTMMAPPHHLGLFPAAPLPPPSQLMSITQVPAQPPPQGMLPNPEELKRIAQMQQQHGPHQPFPFLNAHPPLPPPLIGEVEQKQREFLNLFHAVNRGQVQLAFLEKELNNPNTPPQSKEIISAVLRETTRSMTPSMAQLPPPVQMMRTSPLHQQQQQGIHSPIPMMNVIAHPQPNRAMIPGVAPPLPIPPQIGMSGPNPQELHMRTQVILQNAMLKKKMEEQQQQQTQQEALNRRNDGQKLQDEANNQSPHYQTQSQGSTPTGGHTRSVNSPTPLAFTPTSVLRKMTADKDGNLGSQQHQQQKSSNQMPNKPFQQQQQMVNTLPQQALPRMILGGGGNNATSQQTQLANPPSSPQAIPTLLQQRMTPNDMKWQTMILNQPGGVYGGMPPPLPMPTSLQKPMGRPILKGPPPLSPMSQQQQPHVPSMVFSPTAKIEPQHHQQRLKNNQTPQHMFNQNLAQMPPQAFASGPVPSHLHQPIPANVPQNMLHLQHQQNSSPQMFQMHQMSLQQQQQMQLQRQLHQQHHPQREQATNQSAGNLAVNNASGDNVNSSIKPGGPLPSNSRDGGLSPTSNQLAQWFSPELLAQASAGKLPQINVNQALSLEEFERNIQQHSSTVLN